MLPPAQTGYNLACLRLLFEGCPKLREVTIASHIGCDRRLKAEFTAFSDAMTVLDEDWTRVYAGVHQVLTVATAVQHSGIALDSLTMSHISQELFATSNPALRAPVRPLRRLRMAIHTLHSREGGDSTVTIIADTAMTTMTRGSTIAAAMKKSKTKEAMTTIATSTTKPREFVIRNTM